MEYGRKACECGSTQIYVRLNGGWECPERGCAHFSEKQRSDVYGEETQPTVMRFGFWKAYVPVFDSVHPTIIRNLCGPGMVVRNTHEDGTGLVDYVARYAVDVNVDGVMRTWTIRHVLICGLVVPKEQVRASEICVAMATSDGNVIPFHEPMRWGERATAWLQGQEPVVAIGHSVDVPASFGVKP